MGGLSRADIDMCENSMEMGRKIEERMAAIMQVIENIIKSGMVDFPPGVSAAEVYEMLDPNGDGELTHQEFVQGLGRILLSNPLQTTLIGYVHHGMTRKNIRKLAADVDGMRKDMSEIQQSVSDLNSRMDTMEHLYTERM